MSSWAGTKPNMLRLCEADIPYRGRCLYMYELGLSQVGLPQSGVAVTVTATVAGKTAAGYS